MAVLVALLLTGKPRSRPEPALATPSASSSRLGLIVSPRRANDRAVSTSSLNPTISTVNAGSTSSRKTCGLMSGSRGAGRPAGIGPTTPIPWLARPNTAVTAAAPSTASSGPGACGQRQRSSSKKARTAAASATVASWARPMSRANEPIWVKNASPVTGTPVTRRS